VRRDALHDPAERRFVPDGLPPAVGAAMLGRVTGAIVFVASLLAQPATADTATVQPAAPVEGSPAPAETAPAPAPAPTPAPTEPASPPPESPAAAVQPAPATTPTEAAPPAVAAPAPASVEPVLPAAEPAVTPALPAQPVPVRTVGPTPIPTESGAFVLVPVGPPPRVQPVPPDVTIRKWHRSAGTLIGVAGASLVGSLVLQALRQSALRRCDGDPSCHLDAYAYEPSLGTYTVLLHGMTVGAVGGAGAMLGNAAATHDVHVRGRAVRKPGLMALGVVMTTVGAITYAGVGMSLYLRQMDGQFVDPAAAQLRRFLLVDPLVVGTAAGAGLIGYAARRKRQGEALAKLRVTAGASGIGVAGQF
jgi:hypothetical protein